MNETQKQTLLRLSGLWKNKGKDGSTFLTGHLNSVTDILILPNKLKKKDTEPDFNMFMKARTKREDDSKIAQGDDDFE